MHGRCTRGQSTRRTSLSQKAHPGDHIAFWQSQPTEETEGERNPPSERQHGREERAPSPGASKRSRMSQSRVRDQDFGIAAHIGAHRRNGSSRGSVSNVGVDKLS